MSQESQKANLPTGVKHSKPSVIKFMYQGRIVDLRKITPARAMKLAKDKNCSVLEQTTQEAKKTTGDPNK
jgi:hypothetical protein